MILAALHREVTYALAQRRRVVRIRVTDAAIPGSLTCVPYGRHPTEVEIVLHPDDWDDRGWDLFCGIPVEVYS